MKNCSRLPDCLEKAIVMLFYYTCLKLYKQVDTIYQEKDFDSVLEALYQKIPHHMKSEKVESAIIKNKI